MLKLFKMLISPTRMNNITISELKEKLENPEESELFVDVRMPSEFSESHIESSLIKNIPLPELTSHVPELKDKKVYLICQSGNRSSMAQKLLLEADIQAYNVEGGMFAWQAEA